MKKSKFILAVFFSVMLENIVAMDINGQQQQQNNIVEIEGIRYSQYDSDHNTVKINDQEYFLDEPDLLRVYSIKEAAKLGLYENLLGSKLSQFGRAQYEFVDDNLTWGDYILYNSCDANWVHVCDSDTVYNLGLCAEQYLDRNVPNCFFDGPDVHISWREFIGINRHASYRTWMVEEFRSSQEKEPLLKAARLIYGPILNDDLSTIAMLLAFENKVVNPGYHVKWSEYLRYKDPFVADLLGLYASDFLQQTMPVFLINDYTNYGVFLDTWAEYVSHEYVGKVAIKFQFSEDFLNKKVNNQTLNKRYELNDLLKSLDFGEYVLLCCTYFNLNDAFLDRPFSDGAVAQFPKYKFYTRREFLFEKRHDVAKINELWTDDFFNKKVPNELLLSKGLGAGLTWWEVMCNKHSRKMLNKLAGLSRRDKVKFLQQVYVNSGKDWRNEIIPESMWKLHPSMKRQTWRGYVMGLRFFQKQGIFLDFPDGF